MSGGRRSPSALVVLLLKDNTSYFMYVEPVCQDASLRTYEDSLFLLLNIAQVISQRFLGDTFNPIPTFMTPLTTIIISRLILRMRRFAHNSACLPVCSQSSDAAATQGGQDLPESMYDSYLSTVAFCTSSPMLCEDIDQQRIEDMGEHGNEILEVLREQADEEIPRHIE
ncbi:hypothetical protein FOMPIDRAFT_1045457 [Fomitopsis schrenkii]|uniref:Uncharacterized protein n=1 Tax=Fomitopsis schrenkii TaxID=2126942 RepID=S8EI17_FOMSC|nr:hypothetical protein FOMPIDRAFT_1045457 [Fomitopsis schrenkii]